MHVYRIQKLNQSPCVMFVYMTKVLILDGSVTVYFPIPTLTLKPGAAADTDAHLILFTQLKCFDLKHLLHQN